MIIRRATVDDVADITAMIHELAAFERAAEHCTVTEKQIATALFDDEPTVHGHVAVVDGRVAAMALWFLGCPVRNLPRWPGPADRRRRPSARPAG